MITENTIPKDLLDALNHGKEETYLEYKGDVPWTNRAKMLEIVETIFSLSNEKGGGIIVVGVKDDGEKIGLSDDNYNSYNHDQINQYIDGRGNQQVQCRVEKFEQNDDGEVIRKFVFIQVAESREFPLVYTGRQELKNDGVGVISGNIGLRTGALYIRNKLNVGNKEIVAVREWQELIERTYKKYEKESVRRYSIVRNDEINPFDSELNI